MKRLLVLVLATALVAVSLVGCTPGGSASGTLIVGCPPISGDFIYGFGNSSYDKWVKDLTGGYMSTYDVTPEGAIVLNNTVVKKLDVVKDDAGNKIYTFELNKDLKWNDGSAITAKDYVFTILWEASPAWVAAGASASTGDGLLGYKAYFDGETTTFAGVHLIDDYKFSVTIDAEMLPYFFETSYASTRPLPMTSWSPDAKIESSDAGSTLTSDNEEWTLDFDCKRVAQIERFAPTVSCGPYNFVSFENNAVTLKVNPEFKGDMNGKKPQLEYIIVRYINSKTDVDQVINGSVDAVTGVIEGEKIEKALNDDPNTKVTYYPRNGYGGVFIHCDFSPTDNPNVRHALAYLMDRQEIIKNVLGGYGSVVNGQYGLAQWMYEDNKAEIDALPNFVLNHDKANELLDETEWKFEADGKTPFDASKATADSNYFRHNAKGEVLAINHLGTEENDVTDNVEIQWKANCPYAGIKFSLTRSDFAKLLDHYYEGFTMGEEREFNTFNLATGFTAIFDPYYDYHSDFYHVLYMQTEQVKDDQLDEIIIRMRSLEPTQVEEYSAAWLEYQQRWNQLLPVIPLYSNQYYDIYSGKVEGFETTPFLSWAEMICEISKAK
ncbi:MAG: ABC transporter substrate-binding protein [Eubacteriales bacterium]|nr:ABC transporter substrate-binding protein [Eubacteriales bacterium]